MKNNIIRSFKNAHILIVGGAGFVGSNLVHFLLDNSSVDKIYIIDNLLSSESNHIPVDSRVHFIFGSATDDNILYQIPEVIDFVFHLACYHGNQSSIKNPLLDHENSILTSLKLFERLKNFETLKAVVYAGAGCAVAEKTYGMATATSEDSPIGLSFDSPYSISKIVGEMYGNYYFHTYGLPLIRARFQNVYGPWEVLGAGQWRGTHHTVWRNVIPTFIFKAIHGEALPLDNGGNVSRDFIYVDDLVRGLVKCAICGNPGEAYNLATGIETTILELAEMINDMTDNPTPPELKPARQWDRSGKRFASIEKSEKQLGFKAKKNIKQGLKETILWTQENISLILDVMKKHRYFVPEISRYFNK